MNDEHLLETLTQQYISEYPRSKDLQEQAKRYLVDGGSHALRLFGPYPFRPVSASGSRVRDADGHEILDFWQGHYSNILGHNPPVIRETLIQALQNGEG
ncbi:MAG: hypothetical protein WBH57_04995, partial [Anaerolineae bacterium]